MALRALMLARKIAELEGRQTGIEQERAALTERIAALETRESEAERAFAEITAETPQEERDAFDAEAAEIEREHGEIDAAQTDIDTRAAEVERDLTAARTELDGINQRAAEAAAAAGRAAENNHATEEERTTVNTEHMSRRERIAEICTRSEVKDFAASVRANRAVGSPALAIPDVMLDIIADEVAEQSKLIPYVDSQTVKGSGRAVIMAGVPEAIWTETFGELQPVNLNLYRMTVLGGKVSNYLAIPNPLIQDNDVNLVNGIISRLAAGQARAIDRAILYGTGVNMPVGIMTRLAATAGTGGAAPAWWDATAPEFTDIHSTNIGHASSASLTGLELFKALATFLGKAKHTYSGTGRKFWAMSEATALKLKIAAMEFNSGAAIVSGVTSTLPVIGGDIVELDSSLIPDDTIIGGYGDQYLHADRASVEIRVSDQVKFIQDQTVYAAVSRHDGKPKAGEGFVAWSLTTSNPASTTTWPTPASN